MSTKSTNKHPYCGACYGNGCCYEVPFVVMGDDFVDYYDLHLRPCEFFGCEVKYVFGGGYNG